MNEARQIKEYNYCDDECEDERFVVAQANAGVGALRGVEMEGMDVDDDGRATVSNRGSESG